MSVSIIGSTMGSDREFHDVREDRAVIGGILRAQSIVRLESSRFTTTHRGLDGGQVMLKLGIVLGLGAAAWYWRKEIGSMLDTQFPGMLEKTAQTLNAAGKSSERLYDQAKSHVGSV